MRSVRLLTIGALGAALLLPTGMLAQAPAVQGPAGTGFAATLDLKAFTKARVVPLKAGKVSVPVGKTVNAWFVSETGAPDPTAGQAGWKNVPTDFKLADADGAHTVYIWARATGGVVSDRGEDTTFLDRVAPAVGDLTTVPAQDVTPPTITSRSVNLSFDYADPGEDALPDATGSGVLKYAVVNGVTPPVPGSLDWKTAPNATGPVAVNGWKVTNGNGLKTVSVFVRDRAGNVSAADSVQFTLTITGPSVTLTAPTYSKTLKPTIKVQAKVGSTVISGASFLRKVTTTNVAPAAPLATAPGWVTAPTSATMLQEGDNYLWVWGKDSNGTISGTPASAKIIVDTAAPSAAFEFTEVEVSGTDTTADRAVTYAYTMDDLGGSPLAFWAIKDGTAVPVAGDWKVYGVVSPTGTWTLPLVNGTKTVTLWLKDSAGNVVSDNDTIVMTLATPTVTVDITAPDAYKNGSNAWFTKNLVVAADIDWTDTAGVGKAGAQYKLTLTNVQPTTWSAAATSITLANASDGSQTIHAWVKDKNGSVGHGTTTIYLDRTGPDITFTAPAMSKTRDITLTISADDSPGSGLRQYAVLGGTTQPASNSVAWVVSPNTSFQLPNAEGTSQITVWTRDFVGNVTHVTHSVLLDRIAPTATLSVTTPSKTRNVSVTVGGSDGGSGVVGYLVVEGTTPPAANDPGWLGSAPTTFQVSNGDGTKTISAFTLDAAGNVSNANTKSVVLDTTRPTVSLSAPATTVTQLISVTVTGADAGGSGVASYVVVEGTVAPALNDPAWNASAPTTFSVSSGLGDKTVSAFTVDNAGNVSLASTQTVTLQ